MTWTDERVERLKKLWSDGYSASQIASELGGVTRNAVIGKVHRLGLSGRAKAPSTPAPRPRKMRSSPSSLRTLHPVSRGATALAVEPVREAAPLPALQAEAEVLPMGQRCSILELNESTCRWPIGDPGREGFAFCGGKSAVGNPYCAYHARIAYQPVSDRKREKKMATGFRM